ncbi:hypothetical protein RND81_10G004100 [Saponaria officinalis]|uniref:Uncharacterized protein n=1 Tax=Saponaria officinalis TaxID=3572 RepID=A0AAW1HYU0_SAPOF
MVAMPCEPHDDLCCNNIQMFLHPGNTCRLEGHAFVKSYTGEELEDMEAFRDTAVEAINQYNSCSKKGKLKLERLLKMNSVELHTPYLNGKTSFVDLFGPLLYMTFSATDLESGSSGFYEAAMAEHGGQHLLGLLRDRANDNILTILSISGTDEDLAMKRMMKYNELPRISSCASRSSQWL